MKKITLFIFLLICAKISYSQKVAIIGMNHFSTAPSTDGFTFVALETIPNGEIIYFTENEYNNATNQFGDIGESVVAFVSSGITKGTVVFVNETSADIFSTSCCGTATKTAASSNFALATDGEAFYAYSDSDNNPANGITTIHSVMYTGTTEPSPSNGGDIPTAQNPLVDFPTAIVVDGFPAVQPNRTEFVTTALARTNVTRAILENPLSYVHAQANVALSTQVFTNLNISAPLPVNLIYFAGKNEKAGNVLEWVTASEQNNQGFEIERSSNNLKFIKIGENKGENASYEQKTYSFTDKNIGGNSFYYRLKQIDYNGKYNYSKIIFVEPTKNNEINIYPNPVINSLTIEAESESNIQIFDLIGKQIPVIFSKLSTYYHGNLTEIPKGIYVVKIISGLKQQSKLIVKE